MQYTPRLNLKKPEGSDVVNIDDLNDNADILDQEVTRLATPTQAGRMSADDKAKLDGIEAGAQKNTVHSVNSKTGAVTITKGDVGLGNVDNVKQATKAEFDNHVGDTNNPHNVTKTQIGLGNVLNYGMATQAEAESGTATNRYMSPLRVKQAFEAFQDTYIEETGSNANGNYIRYENGIQICYGVRSVSITTQPGGTLNMFHTATPQLTLPAEFSGISGVSAFASSQDLYVISVGARQWGVSNAVLRVWCSQSFENESVEISFFVIGRWK